MQQVWKTLKRLWPKAGSPLPVAKKNHKGKIVSAPKDIKSLLAREYKDHLRKRPMRPDLLSLRKRRIFKLKFKIGTKPADSGLENEWPPSCSFKLKVEQVKAQWGICYSHSDFCTVLWSNLWTIKLQQFLVFREKVGVKNHPLGQSFKLHAPKYLFFKFFCTDFWKTIWEIFNFLEKPKIDNFAG